MLRVLRIAFLQIVLLGVVLILALLGGEFVARRRFPDLRYSAERQQRAEDLFIQFDERYGWANVPGRQVRFRRLEFDTVVTINEDGFRGPAIPVERADARFRILVLGDSYVFGHGVGDEETFCAVLQQELPATEVCNLGVSGYSTDQELLLLQDRGVGYDPDLVVLCLYRNDVLDNGRGTAWGLFHKPRFSLDAGGGLRLESASVSRGVPFGMRLRRELQRRFVLYDVLAFRWAALRQADEIGSAKNASELTRALVRRVAEVSLESPAEFLLVVLPGLDDPQLVSGLPGSRLDLEPAFAHYRQAHPDSALGFAYDSHWSPRGHRLVAAELARTIREHGWMPDSGTTAGSPP